MPKDRFKGKGTVTVLAIVLFLLVGLILVVVFRTAAGMLAPVRSHSWLFAPAETVGWRSYLRGFDGTVILIVPLLAGALALFLVSIEMLITAQEEDGCLARSIGYLTRPRRRGLDTGSEYVRVRTPSRLVWFKCRHPWGVAAITAPHRGYVAYCLCSAGLVGTYPPKTPHCTGLEDTYDTDVPSDLKRGSQGPAV